jgi:hypothetical protein
MTQIINLLLQTLHDHLTAKMITEIDPSDITVAKEVKIGRFQENPLHKNVYLAISGGDPQDPYLTDGIVRNVVGDTGETDWGAGFKLPTYEVGGRDSPLNFLSNAMWWRRGKVELGCFWMTEQLSEEEAAEKSYEVLGRLLLALETCDVRGLKDSYGERAVKLFPFQNSYFQSGGPPKQYIWRGAAKWQCLTERS